MQYLWKKNFMIFFSVDCVTSFSKETGKEQKGHLSLRHLMMLLIPNAYLFFSIQVFRASYEQLQFTIASISKQTNTSSST